MTFSLSIIMGFAIACLFWPTFEFGFRQLTTGTSMFGEPNYFLSDLETKALNQENRLECIRQSIRVQFDYLLRALRLIKQNKFCANICDGTKLCVAINLCNNSIHIGEIYLKFEWAGAVCRSPVTCWRGDFPTPPMNIPKFSRSFPLSTIFSHEISTATMYLHRKGNSFSSVTKNQKPVAAKFVACRADTFLS